MIGRREFLKIGGLAGLSALFSACEGLPEFEWMIGRGSGDQFEPLPLQDSQDRQRASRLLNRITYGPRPGEIERVTRQGIEAFIIEQLYPDSIPDSQAYWLTRRIETLKLKTPDIFELDSERAIGDLRRSMLLRAVYSERQLLELMVEFWSDHFNIFAPKADCAWLKVVDDRDVIRPHALGKFSDLLRASASSPAMLVYLDGHTNTRIKPNENYARELLELHTLGVDGGYSQTDVMEVARALTGWKVKSHFWRGRVDFKQEDHDRTAKQVLGFSIDGGTGSELDRVIGIASEHPSTARFLSRKLCRRFVSDEPEPAFVERVAQRFQTSGGDIRETLREIFLSEEFYSAPPKFKRPYTFTVSALRALGASTDAGDGLQKHLEAMGQLPFAWPTPDGYPEGETHWNAQLLSRWNFAIDLAAGNIKGTGIDLKALSSISVSEIASSLLQRRLTEEEAEILGSSSNVNNAVALSLCMPDFQYQ
jgi:uncharacterized protein (DUF1800 family)